MNAQAHAALAAKAEAATPGPWKAGATHVLAEEDLTPITYELRAQDILYIAAASPDVVLGLIRDLADANARIREALRVGTGQDETVDPREAMLDILTGTHDETSGDDYDESMDECPACDAPPSHCSRDDVCCEDCTHADNWPPAADAHPEPEMERYRDDPHGPGCNCGRSVWALRPKRVPDQEVNGRFTHPEPPTVLLSPHEQVTRNVTDFDYHLSDAIQAEFHVTPKVGGE